MDTMKHYFRRILAKLKAACARLEGRLDELIPSRRDQAVILALFFAGEAVLAYLIALLHIGIWHHTASILQFIRLYAVTDASFPLILFFILSAILFFIGYNFVCSLFGEGARNFLFSKSDIYGSAREISPEDLETVADVGPIECVSGTILGQLGTSAQKVIAIPPNPVSNKNLLVFGTPGQGKTYALVEPMIVQAILRGESVVTTDVKGDGFSNTLEIARRFGYTVRRIDLRNVACSDGIDFLAELRHDDVRAMIFADVIMANSGNPKDPHIALEQSLLRACALYVERNPHIPPQEKTFYNVYAMIQKGAGELDKIFDSIKMNRDLRIAYDAYTPFKGSDNLRGNVIANLSSRLQILTSPDVQRMTSIQDVDLSLPGRKKCIYYLVLSDQHETMKFLATMFFSFLFLDLTDYADSQRSHRLDVPVNVILEEAAQIGEIPNLTKYLSAARSRGISITMIFQDLGQLQTVYGLSNTSTIMTDCAIHACLGTNSKATAEIFEWESGESTVTTETQQHAAYESPFTFRHNHSTGDGRRYVYTSNEIRKIKKGEIMIGWQGYDTLKCNTVGINLHPEYIKGHMVETDPITKIPLSNTEARAYLRAKEEERVERYEDWIRRGGNPLEGYLWAKRDPDKPVCDDPMPEIIPYVELEQEALEYARQATEDRQLTIHRQIMEREAEETDVILVPDNLVWEYCDSEEPDCLGAAEGESCGSAEGEDETPPYPGPAPQRDSYEPPESVTPVILDRAPFDIPTSEPPQNSRRGASLYSKNQLRRND